MTVKQYEISGAKQRCPLCECLMEKQFDGVPNVIGTDSQYYRNQGPLLNQFRNRHDMNIRLKAARKRGFRPGINDVYEPGLAKFPGDPEAFISGGRSQLKQRIADMKHVPETPPVPLAEKVIRDKAREMIKQNPDLAHVPKGELREKIIQKHGAKL